MLSTSFRDELKVKEQATGLSLLVPGVSWHEHDPMQDLDPLPSSLTTAQRDAINQVVAAHVYVAPILAPDWASFLRWMPTAFDAPTLNAFAKAYPVMLGFCQFGNREGVQWCILDGKINLPLTVAQYALFQQANLMYHLGMVLP